jgi:hypothetical protein
MIDYRWVSEDTKPEFEAVLKMHGLKFLRWRLKSQNRKNQPLAAAFKNWWMVGGPTGFRTNADCFRFQQELLSYVETSLLSEAA